MNILKVFKHCSLVSGLSEIFRPVTFQMLCPSATTNYGGLWPLMASL